MKWSRYSPDSRQCGASQEASLGETIEGFEAQLSATAIRRGRGVLAAMARRSRARVSVGARARGGDRENGERARPEGRKRSTRGPYPSLLGRTGARRRGSASPWVATAEEERDDRDGFAETPLEFLFPWHSAPSLNSFSVFLFKHAVN